MPNIELHGYEPEAAVAMKTKVREALNMSPDADEIVTTIIPSEVEDLKGKKTPFLRVISSPDELPDLKVRLTPLNEDIEVIMLGEWIPKSS
jgi:hypothetical protein